MGLIDDYKRYEAGGRLLDWKNTFLSEMEEAERVIDGKAAVLPLLAHCQKIIDKMAVLKTEYPVAAAEIDGYITTAQTRLDNFKAVNGIS